MTKQKIIRNLITLSGCGTQKKFAEKHGFKPERISEWKRGTKNIHDKTLSDIAEKEGYKLSIEFKLEKL